MKVVIHTPIQLSVSHPYHDYVRGELNLRNVRVGACIPPAGATAGAMTILPQMLVLEGREFEQIAEVISKYNRSGSSAVTLHRESYQMYRLETA